MDTEKTGIVQPPPARSKGLDFGIWIAIGCGTLLIFSITGVVLFVMLVLRATSGPVDVANMQLEALKKGQLRKAYNYSSVDFKNSISFNRFKVFLDTNPSLKDNRSSTFNNRKIENNVATISGTLESNQGGVTPVEYRFVKENGRWKILFINLNQGKSNGERGKPD